MIKKRVTITYRDDSKQIYECVKYPWIEGPYLVLDIDNENLKYIPNEFILEINLKEVWQKTEIKNVFK